MLQFGLESSYSFSLLELFMITLKQKVHLQAILTLAHQDHQRGLNARAFFKVHDHAIGEDLVQDTFVKTWSYLLRGGKIDIMKAFLYHATQ